jgi:nickel/cobalt exporter
MVTVTITVTGCGHAHAPAAEQVAAATSTRELLALIGAVAIRPCTGAIFLLILTAQMGVFIWGIAGTHRHGAGHGVGDDRRGTGGGLPPAGRAGGPERRASRAGTRVQPALEIAVGLTVAWIAGGLALAW